MKIGFLINYGPEIRSLLLSGLASEIEKKGNDVFILSRFPLPCSDFPSFCNYTSITTPGSKRLTFIKRIYSKLIELFNKIWRARLRKMGYGNFHFSSGYENDKSQMDLIVGSEFIFRIGDLIIKSINAIRTDVSEYMEFIRSNNIEAIFFSGFSDLNIHLFLVACKKTNVKLFYISNNWKDIYTNHYFPVKPDFLTYWSEELYSDAIKINPNIIKSKFLIGGNPYFFKFRNYKTKRANTYYKEKYQIDDFDNRLKILWPLSQTSIFPYEHILVEKVIKYLNNTSIKNKPVIFLRLNPLGLSEDIIYFYKQLKISVLCENYWLVDKQNNITYQNEYGEDEWADLLHYSDLIISSPSTVALEAALFSKPLINFLINENDEIDPKISSFKNAAFYKEIISMSNIFFAKSINELVNLILTININKKMGKLPKIIEGNNHHDIHSFVRELGLESD